MHLMKTMMVQIVDLVMRLENRKLKARLAPIRRPKILPEREQREAYDRLWKQSQLQGANPFINYNLPYPKIDFLNYLCDHGGSLVSGGIVAHGSNQGDHSLLEPVRKSQDVTEFGNRQQIFATPDAIYATWFAILDKDSYRSTKNACMRVGPQDKNWVKLYYYYLRREDAAVLPYKMGYIYLCRALDFPSRRRDKLYTALGLEVEEYGSAQPVNPLARITVEPAVFPYLDKVEFVL